MKLLLDTHLLLWAAGHQDRVSVEARKLIDNQANELLFGAASLWEVVIKRGFGGDIPAQFERCEPYTLGNWVELDKAGTPVVEDPRILSRTPVNRNTRIAFCDIATSVAAGMPTKLILAAYPWLRPPEL